MLGQRARPVRRAAAGKLTPETVHGVPPPTRHMELDKLGAELMFQVITEREENSRRSRPTTATPAGRKLHRPPVLRRDRRSAPQIIDRLTFGGHIIETGTDGYRLAHTKAQAAYKTHAK